MDLLVSPTIPLEAGNRALSPWILRRLLSQLSFVGGIVLYTAGRRKNLMLNKEKTR